MGDVRQPSEFSRRMFLGLGIAGLVCANPVTALAARGRQTDRKITFHHQHTGEKLTRVFWSKGRYVRQSLYEINRVLRDFRSDEVVNIDPSLLDLLWSLQQRAENQQAIRVFSAYRSPTTNAQLRRRSRGVARHSYHMKGKAIDLAIPGLTSRQLVRVARAMSQGGVGYYPRGVFVHVDTGPVRYWRG